ncbi:Cystinosin/ERS1p repeat protein [Cordyceps fumosorosea ARSEF 2679]|uniref:Cystinosin/ERS1p repeat protein n=1 Tax=Cordyceps fumosorosea (strain ARSEF 2679) TaxID=1081104 RepID=A0A167ZFA8_CORFA|nr:Cystinosin/ERS1p repeat protein [Cordyceps fumosorosea ARSEF 2679]OAA67446.1 Cystinosin/ERS1p repeat protein [Cordyceps fumosorosea ARSEF 2679]
MPPDMARLSAFAGWTSAALWTVSFYPFMVNNYRRRSTDGLSIDFCLLDVLGAVSYAVYNLAFALAPVVRRQYAARNPASPTPPVRANDVAYALHGLALSAVVYSQFYPRLWHFDRTRPPARVSVWCAMTCWYCICAALLGAFVAATLPELKRWMWLDVVYLVSNIKTFLVLLRYVPQTWLNYRRKSTRGLPLLPFVLDMTGGVLSLLQLLIDSAYHDQSPALANPVKLAIAIVVIVFALAFFFQRFVLYKDAVDEMTDPKCIAERRWLLDSGA